MMKCSNSTFVPQKPTVYLYTQTMSGTHSHTLSPFSLSFSFSLQNTEYQLKWNTWWLSSEDRLWHVAFPFFSRKTWSSALVGKTINNNKFTAEYTHTHINLCIRTIQWSLGNIVWHENEIWGQVGSHFLHSSSCLLLTEYTHFPSETIHMITCIHKFSHTWGSQGVLSHHHSCQNKGLICVFIYEDMKDLHQGWGTPSVSAWSSPQEIF